MIIKEKCNHFYVVKSQHRYFVRTTFHELFYTKGKEVIFKSYNQPKIKTLNDNIDFIKGDLINLVKNIPLITYGPMLSRSEYMDFDYYFKPIFRKIKLEGLLNDI